MSTIYYDLFNTNQDSEDLAEQLDKDTTIASPFANWYSDHIESEDTRSAVKSIRMEAAEDGYLYYLERIYRNHSVAHEQIYIYKYKISDATTEFFAYAKTLADPSILQDVTFEKAGRSEVFYITIDYTQIPDGGLIGQSSKMFINPSNYIYDKFTDLIIDSLSTKFPYLPTNTPVGSATTFTLEQCGEFLVDLYLDGTYNPAKDYRLRLVRRNYTSTTWLLYVYEDATLVSFFQVTSSPEDGDNITIHDLKESGGSGITGKIAVRWSVIDEDVNYEMLSSDYILDPKVWDNKNAFIINSAIAIETVETRTPTLTTIAVSRDDGLTAISDALDAITDATEYKRYKLIVDGHFIFTDPLDVPVANTITGEYAIIEGKNWVDIEGLGKDRTVISMEFNAGSVFHSTKTYIDYQPVIWNCNSKLTKMSVIGKNCRYTKHIEGGNAFNDKEFNIENLYLRFKGATEMGGSAGTCVGTGINSGQVWNFKNCDIIGDGDVAFAMHSALQVVEKGGEVNFNNCSFFGRLSFANYPVERIVNVTLTNCSFDKTNNLLTILSTSLDTSISADYSLIKIRSNTHVLTNNIIDDGKGLRIKSKTTGILSKIIFDETSTAFNSIIGDSTIDLEDKTDWLSDKKFGYEYKFGGVGLAGYAISHTDVDETAGHTSLGILLGDCSITSKTLSLNIDGTDYNILFDADYTASSNAAIIAIIDVVIGSVADTDTFVVGSQYYPEFNNMSEVENADTTAILAGMGIVFLTNNTMRRALNSDNRIDGVCLYDTVVGENGRCLKSESLYSMNSGLKFSTLETVDTQRDFGDELGISASSPGYFELSTAPSLLRCTDTNVLKIL
jgi:hypothetical protein